MGRMFLRIWRKLVPPHDEKLRSKCAKEAQYRVPILGTWIWILRFGDRFGILPDVPPASKPNPWRWKPRFVRFRGFCPGD